MERDASAAMGNETSKESSDSDQSPPAPPAAPPARDESASQPKAGKRNDAAPPNIDPSLDADADRVEPGQQAARKSRKHKKHRQKSSEVIAESDDENAAASPAVPEAEGAAAPGNAAEKKKKRKHGSPPAEEGQQKAAAPAEAEWPDAAQALIGLSQGVVPAEGETAGQPAEDEQTDGPTDAHGGDAEPPKKKKRKHKKKSSDAGGEDEKEDPPAPESPQNEPQHGFQAVNDTPMPDAAPAATPSPVIAAAESSYAADTSPFEAVISQHLATHMSKTADVEPRLTSALQQNGFGTQLAQPQFPQQVQQQIPLSQIPLAQIPNTQDLQIRTVATPAKKPRAKRKRADAETDLGQPAGLVDPQLMQMGVLPLAPASATAAPSAPRPRTKRRPAAGVVIEKFYEDEEDEKPQQKSARQKRDSGKGDDPPGGTFSVEERFEIDKALQKYKEMNEMDENALRARIWGNQRRKDEFWNEICYAVPNRSRASVYKHVRRTYHVFEMRAKWTDEEDEQLAALVAEKGHKWKDIGDAMHRMGEDCRDRYRNYVKCGKDRGTDRWSEEEEAALHKAVEECQARAAQALMDAGRSLPSEPEDLINWTRVSDDMGNRRSRIQCRYKWRKMAAQKERQNTAPPGTTYIAGKKKRVVYDVKKMTPGDKLWLLKAIRDSGATSENDIDWERIAKDDKEVGIWNHKDLKTAYKNFRSHIPYRRRPLGEIIRQLLDELASSGQNTNVPRYIPDPSIPPPMDQFPIPPQPTNGAYNYIANQMAPVAMMNSTPALQSKQAVGANGYGNVDPSLVDGPPASTTPRGHTPHSPRLTPPPASSAAQKGGELGVGDLADLERTAGEAIAFSQAAAAAGGKAEEDENERVLREQLTKFVGSSSR